MRRNCSEADNGDGLIVMNEDGAMTLQTNSAHSATSQRSDLWDWTICVISPQRSGGAPTFIRCHIERLPGRIKELYGGDVKSLRNGNDVGIEPPLTLWRHSKQVGARKVLKRSWKDLESAPLKRYLIENQVDAVLAEYGPTGVMVMNACHQAGVPLVVHFHGYDAYEEPTLERMGQRYHQLFESAVAIVAVCVCMEDQLLRLGVSRTKLHYNPYGVDLSLFQGADAGQAPPVLLSVGRFVDKKAPDLTLMAFSRVLRRVSRGAPGDGWRWSAVGSVRAAGEVTGHGAFRGPPRGTLALRSGRVDAPRVGFRAALDARRQWRLGGNPGSYPGGQRQRASRCSGRVTAEFRMWLSRGRRASWSTRAMSTRWPPE